MSDEDFARAVGQNVKAARETAGLTQKQLGERAGIAPPHVSRLETGEHLPSLKTVKRVADSLGVEVADLLPKPARRRGGRK
jgi:transcriptional regulator with XRE-family HTH domain